MSENHDACVKGSYDDAAFITWQEEQDEEHELEEEAGLLLCSKCGCFAVKETITPTRQYGGGYNTFTVCRYCGDSEVAT